MLINEDKLSYINIVDTIDKVYGIAYVKKGFKAQLHFHKEPETYFFIYGSGRNLRRHGLSKMHSQSNKNINPVKQVIQDVVSIQDFLH